MDTRINRINRVLSGLKTVLHRLDEFLHIIIAFLLVAIAFSVAFYTISHFKVYSPAMALTIIDDIMLMLIILELLWPVLKFLRREKFSLSPFIYVGIMSGVRKILTLEAKSSIEHLHGYYYLIEIGVSAAVVLALGIVLLIYAKAKKSGMLEDD
jgi:uncharacterized membrane protein (DUF373 family)